MDIQPLYHLISGENAYKKTKAVVWDVECKETFQKLKETFMSCYPPSICQFYKTV